MFINLQMATPHIGFDIGIVFYTSGIVLLDSAFSTHVCQCILKLPISFIHEEKGKGKTPYTDIILLGMVSGPLSSVWKEWVKWCVEFGIEANAIIAVPYDWRLPPSMLEERDLYFHKLKFVTLTSTCYEATKFHTSDRVQIFWCFQSRYLDYSHLYCFSYLAFLISALAWPLLN